MVKQLPRDTQSVNRGRCDCIQERLLWPGRRFYGNSVTFLSVSQTRSWREGDAEGNSADSVDGRGRKQPGSGPRRTLMPADFSVGTHSASGNPRGFYRQPTARRQTLSVSPSPQPESWQREDTLGQ